MKIIPLIYLAVIIQATFSSLLVLAGPTKRDLCHFTDSKLEQEWERHKVIFTKFVFTQPISTDFHQKDLIFSREN